MGPTTAALGCSQRLIEFETCCDAAKNGKRSPWQLGNPGEYRIIVDEHAFYFRIKVEGECVIVIGTVSRLLGRPVAAGDIEVAMPGFSGFIRTSSDRIRFLASA
jgi:hypothetical protein